MNDAQSNDYHSFARTYLRRDFRFDCAFLSGTTLILAIV